MSDALLHVEGMSVEFRDQKGQWLPVTDDVSFQIAPGEVFALVGESGCGKSVTAMGLLGLLPYPGARIPSGRAFFEGEDLFSASKDRLYAIRGKRISVIFQEPVLALNPVRTVESQLREVLPELSPSMARERIAESLHSAGFSDIPRILASYPHELSGGMAQRVVIAMALLPTPRLLIADEPTTALDVTVQAQVMDLLRKLCRAAGTGLLLITHNLGLVAQYADRVGVMYAGRLVEQAPVSALLKHPLHPYTRGLLAAVPDGRLSAASLRPIPGSVPSPREFDRGCRFRNRCPLADEACSHRPEVQNRDANHQVSCFHLLSSAEVDS
ncbi:MAG TPA: ABC transporter ATP-binding protein [Fibrobacteraceae bacterium]|nr:ABC transporter ATP-binding protein [Fibrobacteraceae bacterium]